MNNSSAEHPTEQRHVATAEINFPKSAGLLLSRWRLLAVSAVLAGAVGAAVSYLVAPTFTARTSFLSPQQQGGAGGVLAQLGALASLTGGIRTPADQYAAVLQSETVANHIIDRFKLMDVYDAQFRVDARKTLSQNMRVNIGKKDNLITVEVDDHEPKRAADMANAFVDELRTMTNVLALTEAQQRRVFFEKQMQDVHARLGEAQAVLQKTGFNPGAIKSEPKAAAEAYAQIKAQIAAAEVRLQATRSTLADSAAEVRGQLAALARMRSQLASIEEPSTAKGDQDYVSAYRQFKYQEALFEIISRQYELAKVEEAREGAVLQTVDAAVAPERRSKPKRALMVIQSAVLGVLLCAGWLLIAGRRRGVA